MTKERAIEVLQSILQVGDTITCVWINRGRQSRRHIVVLRGTNPAPGERSDIEEITCWECEGKGEIE